MAGFGRQPLRAHKQVPADNDSHANAGALGDVDHVVGATARAIVELGKRRQVGIVAQIDRYAEGFEERIAQIHMMPPGQICSREQDSAVRIRRAGCANADGRGTLVAQDTLDGLYDACDHRIRALVCLGHSLVAGNDRPFVVCQYRADLRATEINADNIFAHAKSFIMWRKPTGATLRRLPRRFILPRLETQLELRASDQLHSVMVAEIDAGIGLRIHAMGHATAYIDTFAAQSATVPIR